MLGLGIGFAKLSAFIRGIVRKNLQLWLPFEKSEILGEELVVNGDFATDSDWTKGSDWTISGGEAVASGSGNNIQQSISFVAGKTYLLKFDVTSTSGSLYFDLGGSSALSLTDSGSKEYYIEAVNSNNLRFYGASYFGSIDNVSVKEVTQIAPDISSNSNSATLYTGKALSFDGVHNLVDVDGFTLDGDVATFAFWMDSSNTSGRMFDANPTRFIISFDSTQLSLYDGSWHNFGSVTTGEFHRVVITINDTLAKCFVDGVQLGSDKTITAIDLSSATAAKIGSRNTGVSPFFSGTMSDFQIYNAAWTTSDVTFDYNNPQHLVTDNSASSITLSNLKGYWHLSEGDGDYAYNSAIPLGSEEVVNGGFDGVPDGTDVTTLTNWFINGTPTSTDVVNEEMIIVAAASGDGARYNLATSVGSTYHLTFNASGDLGASGVNIQSLGDVSTLGGVGRKTFTALSTTTKIYFRAGNNEVGTTNYDNISAKLASVGTINGATPVLAQPTIPQLGMMDWAKSTVGSDEITLIQAPNNKGFDILGNPLRLREHGFNLDGSGYAEVPDDDSLDFSGELTLETWVKADFNNVGSIFNAIYSINGSIAAATGLGFYTDSTKVYYRIGGATNFFTYTQGKWYYLAIIRDSSNNFKFYKGDDGVISEVASGNNTVDFTSTESKFIGKDATNDFSREYPNLVDESRAYNRGLSLKEITQNYKAGINKHKVGSSFSDDFSNDYGL